MTAAKIFHFPACGPSSALKQPGIKKPSAPPTPKERAAKALYNARQRCINPKNPDYPKYGGAGIKCLIKTTAELVDAIGLPKADQSLDRIDAHGHYQIGNIRWANQSVQNANKKLSTGGSAVPLGALISSLKAQVEQEGERGAVSEAWLSAVSAYNFGSFAETDVQRLCDAGLGPGALEATFDIAQHPDMGLDHGTFHLPSLVEPGGRVRVRGGPFYHAKNPELMSTRGLIDGLGLLRLTENLPLNVHQAVNRMLHKQLAGLTLVGRPGPGDLRSGWFEGWMLALASRLSRQFGFASACYPAMECLRRLSLVGPRYRWDRECDPVLDTRLLFIPDFQLDVGGWGALSSTQSGRLSELLDYRLQAQKPTVVGVQAPEKLSASLKRRLLLGFLPVPVKATEAHVWKEYGGLPELRPVPQGRLPSTALKLSPVTHSLFSPP